jgi:hypothetical protein
MEITLEKIELVKDRTGVSYAEAKEALEAAEGSVVDAIIAIEEKIDEEVENNFAKQGNAVIENLKALVKKGNVSKIVIKKDDEILLNIPVNLGILGTVIAPWGAVLGVLAAFGTKCTIEVVAADGTIIDVSDTVTEKVGTAVEKGSAVAGEVKAKGADLYQEVKEKGTEVYESAKEKASDVLDKVKSEAEEFEFDFDDEEDDDFEIEIVDVEEDEIKEVKEEAAETADEEK